MTGDVIGDWAAFLIIRIEGNLETSSQMSTSDVPTLDYLWGSNWMLKICAEVEAWTAERKGS